MTSVAEKIQKLLALSQSPNEHEAALAAERAQELMLKYGIDWESIPVDDGTVQVRTDFARVEGKVDPWRRVLAEAVANSVGGETVWSNDYRKWTGSIEFFVPAGTGQSTVELYRYLERQLDVISATACAAREETWVNSMRWRRSWLMGAAIRLDRRLKGRLASAGHSRALVVLKTAVQRAKEEKYPSLSKDGYSASLDARAYDHGTAAADRIALGDPALKSRRELAESN